MGKGFFFRNIGPKFQLNAWPTSLLTTTWLILVLVFAGCSTSKPSPETMLPQYHTITKGESVRDLTKRYRMTVDELLSLNGLLRTSTLRVGQRLLVGYLHLDNPHTHPELNKVTHASKSTKSFRPARPHKEMKLSGGRIAWPLGVSAKYSSEFGPRGNSFHDGVDFAVPEGTPVLSSHSGVVAYAGSGLSGYGNLVVVQGDDSLITVYAHNSEILVAKGERVLRGQTISRVGDTGRARGAHLHFEVRAKDRNGKAVAVDPMPLLQADSKEKPDFRYSESLEPLMAWLNQ